jgi:cysteinyl-tRNA synthetase
MIELVEQLIAREHAYVAADGAVYFDVATFPQYGQLSGNTTDRLLSGAGGRIDESDQSNKRSPADFLLWKPDARHLMKWDSPWGVGYPGWHIECSAMAMGLLGAQTIDIHTGGEDNLFPHHECEIAQATGATGKPFVHYWLHARHLMVEGEKMSKSKGNFYTVRDMLGRGVEPAVLRFELLKAPYRQNANFTFKGLADSERQIRRLRQFAASVVLEGEDDAGPAMGDTPVEAEFAAALADDLNISAALGALNQWINATAAPRAEDVRALQRMDHVLGVLAEDTAPAGGGGGR